MDIQDVTAGHLGPWDAGAVRPPALDRYESIDPTEEKRQSVAKDFESIFLHQLLEVMKDTIPEPELEDSGSEQIQSMVWSFLAQALADQGGLGLWRQICEHVPRTDILSPGSEMVQPAELDERL